MQQNDLTKSSCVNKSFFTVQNDRLQTDAFQTENGQGIVSAHILQIWTAQSTGSPRTKQSGKIEKSGSHRMHQDVEK